MKNKYEKHISALCERYFITRKVSKKPPCAIVELSKVIGPKIEDESHYLIWLHEIGHIMTHNDADSDLLSEMRAWVWARNAANNEWWNADVEDWAVRQAIHAYSAPAPETF